MKRIMLMVLSSICVAAPARAQQEGVGAVLRLNQAAAEAAVSSQSARSASLAFGLQLAAIVPNAAMLAVNSIFLAQEEPRLWSGIAGVAVGGVSVAAAVGMAATTRADYEAPDHRALVGRGSAALATLGLASAAAGTVGLFGWKRLHAAPVVTPDGVGVAAALSY